jgi:dolichol-phosphate mannosyltransferase
LKEMQQPRPFISVVVPVHNEEGNIGRLIGEIIGVLERNNRYPFEIIVVDDASTDRSAEAARAAAPEAEAAGRPVRLTIIAMPARAGQSEALMTGIEAAAGALIVTMDADLQHDPADIPRLIGELGKQDMVCGVRKNRRDGLARMFCSRAANSFRNLLTGDRTLDSGCTFRVMRSTCVPLLRPLRGQLFGCEYFFHPLTLRYNGCKVKEYAITHRERTSGKSNYRLIRGRAIMGLMASLKIRRVLALKKRSGEAGV